MRKGKRQKCSMMFTRMTKSFADTDLIEFDARSKKELLEPSLHEPKHDLRSIFQ